jgi:lysophospholipid acyltransferase (LPLAT)-like uncharacterized protein
MSAALFDRALTPRLIEASSSLYRIGGAAVLDGYMDVLGHSCELELEDAQRLAEDTPAIFAYWHEWALAGFVFLIASRRPLATLCHPSLKLSPWAEFGRRRGWRIVLGSTGHGGRVAANEVVGSLRDGLSTFVCPDGPAGPRHFLHRGALHMASQSGVPIVPIRFHCTRAPRFRGWDRMWLPLPGSSIRASIGEPITVEGDLEEPARLLSAALG